MPADTFQSDFVVLLLPGLASHMALKPLGGGLYASGEISARYGWSEKARLPRMLKYITSNDSYKEADAPPEPICRLYGHSSSRVTRCILLVLFLSLISQFWNGHFPSFRILDFPRKADLPAATGNPNVEPSASTFSRSASPCRSLIIVLC